MSGMFDAIFSPNRFFKKQTTSYLSSFLTFFIVYLLNMVAFPELILRVVGFFGVKSLVLLTISIPVLYFLNFGIDLLFLGSDRNNWIKTHYGYTYTPYIFTPISVIFMMNFNIHIKILGMSTLISIILWSASLFLKSTGSMKMFILRAVKDSIFIFIWVNLIA